MPTNPDIAAVAAGLTKAEAEFLERLNRNYPLKLADRKEDRARQGCRRKGLASWGGKPKRWRLTEAGRTFLTTGEQTMKEAEHECR